MGKLYRELFYVPKYGKVRDKVMLARMASTIAVIVVCLLGMSITAYAYFSANITSNSNIIMAATFDADVSVQITTDGGTETTDVVDIGGGKYTASLTGGTEYSVTLQHSSKSTAQTGFVILTAENCTGRWHTCQIGRNDDGSSLTVSFKLTPSADTVVTFETHWGTSSNYPEFNTVQDANDFYIQENEVISLTISGTTQVDDTGDGDETTGEDGSSSTNPTDTTPGSETTTEPTTTEPVTTEPEETTGDTSSTESAEEPVETTGTEPTETASTDPLETTATEETQPETTGTEPVETTGTTETEDTQ